jgi:hypothetical protein
MSDQEIIATLVKGRDRCRKLIQLYRNLHLNQKDETTKSSYNINSMNTISVLLSQMLECLHSLPEKPSLKITSEPDKVQAEKIMQEIHDLIEGVIVAEREIRENYLKQHTPPAGTSRLAALRLYAGG